MQVVLDTNILVRAKETSIDHMSVMTLMMTFRHTLLLDHRYELQKEYEDNVGDSEFYRKWFQEMLNRRLVCWVNGCLHKQIVDSLIKRHMHEPEDHLVIALALSGDRYIVTEDSDFGVGHTARSLQHAGVLKYLCNSLGLTLDDAISACARLMHP